MTNTIASWSIEIAGARNAFADAGRDASRSTQRLLVGSNTTSVFHVAHRNEEAANGWTSHRWPRLVLLSGAAVGPAENRGRHVLLR